MSWCKGLINLHQTPEQRREKYWAIIGWGATSARARIMRDWRWTKIYRFFGLKHPRHYAIRQHTIDEAGQAQPYTTSARTTVKERLLDPAS